MLLCGSHTFYWLLRLWIVAGLFVWHTANAQTFLPLQPHKLWYARKVLLEALPKNDSAAVAEACYLFGKTYMTAGDYRTAQFWFMKALRIREQLGDSEDVAKVYHQLVGMEIAQGRPNNARRYAIKTLQVGKRIGSLRTIMQAYAALAQLYDAAKTPQQRTMPLQTDSTFLYFKQVEQLARQLHDTVQIAYIANVYGGLLAARNNPRSIAYHQRSLALYTQLGKLNETVQISLTLATDYLHFGKPMLAKPYLLYARQTYNQRNLSDREARLQLENTSLQYYRAIGDWKRAFRQLETIRTLEESQLVADRNGAISRLNIEYETEKKESLLNSQRNKLTLNAQKQQVQAWFLVALSVFLALAIVVGLVLFRLYRQNQRISRRNAELVREQNHRVKNNLQVLSSLLSLQANRMESQAARQAIEDSQLRVETMALLQRRLYDGDRLATILLPEFLPELVSLVLQTFGYEAVETNFSIEPVELNVDTALRLGLIVNELTTNACKYAFADHPDPHLRLSVCQKKQQLTLTVADNGPGLPEKLRSETSPRSFGLRLIQIQVAQLNGNYEFSNNNGTQFSMHFTSPSLP
jgi:two-component system, sensor histidine kinase PdtaS